MSDCTASDASGPEVIVRADARQLDASIGALPVVQAPRLRGVDLKRYSPTGRPVRASHEGGTATVRRAELMRLPARQLVDPTREDVDEDLDHLLAVDPLSRLPG